MKARDIIPGWPKCKSQRRCWPSAIDPNRPFNRIYFRDHVDIRYLEDWEDEKKERSRKADMMEVHWAEQRILARGQLYPQPLSERMFGFYGFGFLIDPQILAQLEAVNEAANWICGGAPAAEAKERDGR